MGKGDKRRRKRHRMREKQIVHVGAENPVKATHAPVQRASGTEPTPERLARGSWADRKQGAKQYIDRAADVIGEMHLDGTISDQQLNAARHYEEVRARFLAGLPDVSGYKSCLGDNVGGYDAGDGDPATEKEMRAIERAIGMIGSWELSRVVADQVRPRRLDVFKSALDAISAMGA